MEAAAVAASAAAAAARDAALAASVAAAAAAKDAAAAAATAKEATDAAKDAAAAASAAALTAKEAAATASAAALNAKKAAATASAAALDAKEAAAVAVSAGEVADAAAAAMQASKKRKFHHIEDDQDDPPRSADVGDGAFIDDQEDPPRSADVDDGDFIDDQDGPPGTGDVGDGGNVDFISPLPDTVLCSIVSLLPTKEAARTQVISHRWHPLWRSAPLNLVADHELKSKDHTFVDLISKILSVHPGPARRFSLCLSIGNCQGMIKGWLSSQALDKLHEFELIPHCQFDKGRFCHLPSSMYRFAPTLRVAKFGGCRFSKLIGKLSLKFPCLKQLTLDRVAITEDALQGMLSGCYALESLELNKSVGFARLCISSRTLKCISFCLARRESSLFLRELVIKDTPCLERFLLHPTSVLPLPTMRVISAPKLKILGMLSMNIAELQFGTTVFQRTIAVSLTTKMHTMRVLFLDFVGPNLDVVVNFLKCFPCLERLYVNFKRLYPGIVMDNVWKYDPLDLIECLELHLKKVELKNYDGTKSLSVDFAKFFVLNAKMLKEMKITLAYHQQLDWFANQHELLQIKDRASRDAQIELKCGTTQASFTDNKHTYDLSMDDPFDMPSSGCSKCS